MNDINFPAGNSAGAVLRSASPRDAENYGHIGAIVGHELTHGFDDQGSQFDGNGNLSDWWTADDRKKFDDMTDCEVKEYGNFTAVDDVKLNGKLTLGENTADNGGIRLAYDRISRRRQAQRHRSECEAGWITRRSSSSSLPSGRIGAATCGRRLSGCRCRPIRIRRHNSAPTAWCRIFRIWQGVRVQSGPAHDAGRRLPRLVRLTLSDQQRRSLHC